MIIKKSYNPVMRLSTAIGTGCVIGGGIVTIFAGIHLMNYSPWQHPQDLTTGVQLLGVALALFGVPAVMIAIWALRQFRQAAAASGLTPLQMAIARWFAMEAIHLAWHEHNEREAERLTESVMGPVVRKNPWPGQ